jgi:rare lipoprotein A
MRNDRRFPNPGGVARRALAAALIVSLSGCASLMTERTQTVRLTTLPPNRTVFFQGQPVRDGATLTVHRDFEAPAFEIREGDRRVQAPMDYKAEPWIIGDALLLFPFIIPGIVAGALDISTGAWRKLDDPQVIHIENILAEAEAEALGASGSGQVRPSSPAAPASSPSASSPEAEPAKPAPKSPAQAGAVKPGPAAGAPASARIPASEEGIVSWYDHKEVGHRTASGAIFDADAMTAAHRTLPFGAVVRVTRLDTNYSVVVTINDRGPWVEGRIIDLTRRPAEKLGLPDVGIAPCRVEVIEMPGQ